MKTLYNLLHTLILIIFISTPIFCQQEPIFSQFAFQQVLVNPGYAGSTGAPCLNLIHRQQWVGLEGAPATSALSFHSPVLGERVGFGLSLINDRISYYNSTTGIVAYSYRIKINESLISFGVQAQYQQYSTDWEKVDSFQENDPNVGTDRERLSTFNAGAGIYFDAPKFFFGVAIPRFLQKGLTKDNRGIIADFSGQAPHFYVIAGTFLELNKKFTIRPAALFKSSKNAPLNIDINVNLGYIEKFWLGVSYRWNLSKVSNFGNDIDFTFQYQVHPKLRLGVAYDLPLNTIRQENAGTFEAMIQYCFHKNTADIRNPRFF